MARTSKKFSAPAKDVWPILADGWTYSAWVVGTVKIREIDPAWPAVGSKTESRRGGLVRSRTRRRFVDASPAAGWCLEARG